MLTKNSPLDDEKIMKISREIRKHLGQSDLKLENMKFEIKLVKYGGIYKED